MNMLNRIIAMVTCLLLTAGHKTPHAGRVVPITDTSNDLKQLCVLEVSSAQANEVSEFDSAVFLPGGNTLITGIGGAHYGGVLYWDLKTQKVTRDLTVYERGVYQVHSTKDGKWLLGVSAEHALFWRADLGVLLGGLHPNGLARYTRHGALTPDGRYFAVSGESFIDAGNERFTRIYDIRTEKYKSRPKLGTILACSPDGDTIVSCAGKNSLIYSIKKDRVTRRVEATEWKAAQFSPDGSKLAALRTGEVEVLGTLDWAQRGPITGSFNEDSCLQFLNHGQQIAISHYAGRSSKVGILDIFEVATGSRLSHTEFNEPIRVIIASPDQSLLAIVMRTRVEVFEANLARK